MTTMPRKSALQLHCRAVGECRTCGHTHGVVPIVSHAATPEAMLIGQAPGQVEAAGGRPFAGRAGKTLFRWLERAGIGEESARRRIYIAAITRCYPGPSPSGRGDRVPSPAEQQSCAVWLNAELKIIQPRLLIPVGRLAITRFLPNVSLEQLIGRVHDVTHAGGRSIAIPLPHPSGASSWVHQRDHTLLLARALDLLGEELERLGIGDGRMKRSVA